MQPTTAPTGALLPTRWQRFAAASVRGFHAYATWLVGITWKRFFLLAVLLIIGMAILSDLPPFTWRVSETIEHVAPKPPKPPKPAVALDKPVHYDVTIDHNGIRIRPAGKDAASAAASAASGAAGVAASAASAVAHSGLPSISIDLPPGAHTEEIRQAVEDARQAIEEAAADAKEAAADAAEAAADADLRPRTRIRVMRLGEPLMPMTMLFILASIIIKINYKGRLQAEVKAAQATETAESEALKRQVVEARMAAMQAQVEPHFLFNTLASIDHLIETDPPRASAMQKNLIALLRASMPTMREASDGAPRDLGRELAVIRPYLEILKVRMEERLSTAIAVPDGLLSAEFPSMMLQTLVENAIKHGLEPKAEGGLLRVKAEVLHGKLAVSVADTGLGFGKGDTAGTGVGLANIRERLQLLYGSKATLTVAENLPAGTLVTVTVPYKTIQEGTKA